MKRRIIFYLLALAIVASLAHLLIFHVILVPHVHIVNSSKEKIKVEMNVCGDVIFKGTLEANTSKKVRLYIKQEGAINLYLDESLNGQGPYVCPLLRVEFVCIIDAEKDVKWDVTIE